MAKRLTTRGIATNVAWKNLEPFTTSGALAGTDNPDSYTGRMPSEYADDYRAAYLAGDIVYVVTSYATPIGWVLKNGERVKPPVKYSVTTTKHQGNLY